MQIRLTTLVLLLLSSLAVPMPVAADCQPASSVEEALAMTQVAFVGRAVLTLDDGPGAVFQVEEIWVGEVGNPVEIHGMGFAPPGQYSEDDRIWKSGARYLVIPYRGEDGLLRDNICTATTEWNAELDGLRPPDVRLVEPSLQPTGQGDAAEKLVAIPILPLVIIGLIVLLVGGAALVAFRGSRRRAPV